jgi:predicted outer membrane protein
MRLTKEQLQTQGAFDRTAYNAAPTTASSDQQAGTNKTAMSQADSGGSRTVTDPQQFVALATASNMFEIESSKVALDKATQLETKTFAQHMIDDDHESWRRDAKGRFCRRH